jgi:hypothetical protein
MVLHYAVESIRIRCQSLTVPNKAGGLYTIYKSNIYVRPRLKQYMDSRRHAVLDTPLLLLVLHLFNACASLAFSHSWATNHFSLSLSHASVDIDVLDSNPQRTMRRNLEPAVNLPHEVQDNKERPRHIRFEETLDTEVRSADWVKGDVKLGNECNGVDGEAHPRTPNTERGPVWNFIKSMTVQEPRHEISIETEYAFCRELLTMLCGNEYGRSQYCRRRTVQ